MTGFFSFTKQSKMISFPVNVLLACTSAQTWDFYSVWRPVGPTLFQTTVQTFCDFQWTTFIIFKQQPGELFTLTLSITSLFLSVYVQK